MKKESRQQKRTDGLRGLAAYFPRELILALAKVSRQCGMEIYFVGGTVRDLLLDRMPHDLDLTVARGAEHFCRMLMRELGSGTFVRLGTPEEEAARVVWNGLDVDISAFRGGAATIEEDLALRDFTINSMAVSLSSLLDDAGELCPVDPLGGQQDLDGCLLRHCPRAFMDDPLRLLRAYRFMATFGFELDAPTEREIHAHCGEILRVAAERIHYELELVIRAEHGSHSMWKMHESGLLRHILPELYAGLGIEQPEFHHLDVFHHSFQALIEMERLLNDPEKAYPDCAEAITGYLTDDNVRSCLKWAALLHDIGKPATRRLPEAGESRVTFYGHDEVGRKLFDILARRLKWSNEERERTGSLIAMHMHPFHLCNVRRNDTLSRRAALKLCNRAGDNLPGLFLVAMSDSLASRGEQKPEDMEGELAALYLDINRMYEGHIRPALNGPPLLGGRDLIEECHLQPGPIFTTILEEVQALQVEGKLTTRDEALDWVIKFLKTLI